MWLNFFIRLLGLLPFQIIPLILSQANQVGGVKADLQGKQLVISEHNLAFSHSVSGVQTCAAAKDQEIRVSTTNHQARAATNTKRIDKEGTRW